MNKPSHRPNKGEMMTMGGYDWIVLDVLSDRALLLAKNIVEKRAYNEKNAVTAWETCTLRAYLNEEFYHRFSDHEQQLILDTKIVNHSNPEYGTSGGHSTVDKIFLLSIDEANTFIKDSVGIAYFQGSARWWWLRSPGIKNHAAFVDKNGLINVHGHRVDNIYSGVRPALYLNCCLKQCL